MAAGKHDDQPGERTRMREDGGREPAQYSVSYDKLISYSISISVLSRPSSVRRVAATREYPRAPLRCAPFHSLCVPVPQLPLYALRVEGCAGPVDRPGATAVGGLN